MKALMIDVVNRTYRFLHQLLDEKTGAEILVRLTMRIHKAQGSEFPAVVIPLATQHYVLLQRNLVYTGITRGKKVVVLVGQKKALGMAVRNDRTQRRYSGLLECLRGLKGKESSTS